MGSGLEASAPGAVDCCNGGIVVDVVGSSGRGDCGEAKMSSPKKDVVKSIKSCDSVSVSVVREPEESVVGSVQVASPSKRQKSS